MRVFAIYFVLLLVNSIHTVAFSQIGQQRMECRKGSFVQVKVCSPRHDFQTQMSPLTFGLITLPATRVRISMSLNRRTFCKNFIGMPSVAITSLSKPLVVSAKSQQNLKTVVGLIDDPNEQDFLNLEVEALKLTATGDFRTAEDAWTQVLERNSASSLAWASRGECRLAQDKLDEALADYDRAIQLDSSDPSTLMQRGMVLEQLTNYEQALYDYASADNLVYMKNGKGNAAARYAAAVMLGKLGQWKDAQSVFREASELDSSLLLAKAGEALALYQMGEDQQAVSLLISLTKSHPEFTDAFAALAGIYWEGKDLGLAEASWAKAQRGWTGQVARWPPRAVEALDNFLMIRFRQ